MSRNSRQAVAMTSPSPRIEPTLLRVLTAYQGAPFTRDELLKDYRSRHHEHGRHARASWQFIDRNLVRLCNAGVLSVITDDRRAVRRYVVNDHDAPPQSADTHTLSVLRQKLQQHRVDLLTTMGEAEMLDEVCSDLPQLQSDVQPQYNEARDRSVRLLGRIRALETLIADHDRGAHDTA